MSDKPLNTPSGASIERSKRLFSGFKLAFLVLGFGLVRASLKLTTPLTVYSLPFSQSTNKSSLWSSLVKYTEKCTASVRGVISQVSSLISFDSCEHQFNSNIFT